MFIKDYNKTAIIYGEERISYTELIEHIKDYAVFLNAAKGERTAIFFENRPEWVYTFYAGWHTGAINVLVDTMATKEEVDFILRDCEPSLIVTSSKNSPIIDAIIPSLPYKPRVINVDLIGNVKRNSDLSENTPDKDDTALLLYTSGTTGTSKGVMLSYQNVMINVEWNNKPRRININDVMLAVLPTHHSWPLMSTVLCPFDCGATVVQLKKLSGEELMRAMKEHHVTMLTAVPRLFDMIHKGIRAQINKSLIARAMLAVTTALDIMPLSKKVFARVQNELGGET